MGTLTADLKLAARRLTTNPGFALIAIVTLALGLGVNTAIFTVIHAVMRQQLPVAHAQDLYRLGNEGDCCVNSGLQDNYSLFSTRLYEHLRDTAGSSFTALTAFQANVTPVAVRRAGAEVTESLPASFVSATYFHTLGVSPAAGRLLEPADDEPGAAPVFVVSYRTWMQRLSGDPSAIGATFLVGGRAMTLAGVTAPSFYGDTVRPEPAGVWLPLGQEAAIRGAGALADRRGSNWLYALGRLAPGVTPEQASAALTGALHQFLLAESIADPNDREELARQFVPVQAAPGGIDLLAERFQQPLTVLFVMSIVVLLIAAANLANLMLARADRGQAAIRVSLGASSGRLVRQSLTEGVLLAVAGGLVGLIVALAATRAIVSLAFPAAGFLPLDVQPGFGVLAFSLVLTILTGVLFSSAPAWAMSRTDPIDALRGAGRGGSQRSFVPRRALVVIQVALSMVLLTGAGLLTESLRRLEDQTLGFDPENRLVLRVDPPALADEPQRLFTVYDRMIERLERIPGVARATYAMYSPMEGNNWSSYISIAGRPVDPDQRPGSSWNRVGPRYFETTGTRIVRGRAFDERDTPTSARVAIVNEAFVRRHFDEGADPIGQRFGIGDASHASDYEIIGVSADVKYTAVTRPTFAMVFLPLQQMIDYGDDVGSASVQTRSLAARSVILQTTGSVPNLESAVRAAFAQSHPDLTLIRMLPMTEQVSGNFGLNRLLARLTSAYGILALALATLGVYGVTAYGVAQRKREIGIRMALGARPGRVTTDVLRGALGQTIVGLLIGVPAALGAVSVVSTFLYQVEARDPRVLVTAILVLIASAIAAGVAPARRASRINPIEALRS